MQLSVIVPCLNEERYVERTLRSLLDGDFPRDQMEVLVVDGQSQDATRALVQKLARADTRVRLLDNPRGVTPRALNLGVCAARGDIVVRVDCHTTYPPHYLSTLVRTLEETGAEMVGGRVDHVAGTPGAIPAAIALATGCAFGTGSPLRYRRRSGPIDAVQLGCWRRALFKQVGLFDERLLRNQDNEHSARILKAGGRVYMTSEVTVQYHPRSTLAALWRQARLTGMWNAFTERLHPYTFRWRHILPGFFFLGVVLSALLCIEGALGSRPLLFGAGIALLAPYALVNLLAALGAAARHKRPLYAPLVAFVLGSYHFSYGYGIAKGWWLVASGRWRDRLGGAPKEARAI